MSEVNPRGGCHLSDSRLEQSVEVRTCMDGEITGFWLGRTDELNAGRDVPRLFILTQGVFSHTSLMK